MASMRVQRCGVIGPCTNSLYLAGGGSAIYPMQRFAVHRHPIAMHRLQSGALAAIFITILPCLAQDSSATHEDKRAFGVIPNNRTTEASLPFTRISAKQKMTIAMIDAVRSFRPISDAIQAPLKCISTPTTKAYSGARLV